MRLVHNPQLAIDRLPIEETKLPLKCKTKMDQLCEALLALYTNETYQKKLFAILQKHLIKKLKKQGRKGMDLWAIFVLAQVRQCLNIGYEDLQNLANNHRAIRQIMGIETKAGFDMITLKLSTIHDNVSLLDESLLEQINELVVDFGQKEVFKKKETTALRLKTDSFVVETNVHVPTDYNLLWDCHKVCLRCVAKFVKKHNIKGWRKLKNWRANLKSLMRTLGKVTSGGGKNKRARELKAAQDYVLKSNLLLEKLKKDCDNFPVTDAVDLITAFQLSEFMELMEKHIDLVTRRLIKGETIPHEEKLFSVFEQHTELINKGKRNVEFGRVVGITTDQYDLILDYQIYKKQTDQQVLKPLVTRVKQRHKLIDSWSFDKGYSNKENKAFLAAEITQPIMPKKGNKNKAEQERESQVKFKKLRNKHNAIESNINELEHRGLNRCADKGEENFNKYVAKAICAYNLRKIGQKLIQQKIEAAKKEKEKYRQALLAKVA